MRNIIRAGIVVALSFLAFSGPLAAGPLEDAAAAYCRGDYLLAMRLCRTLADQGNSLAQANLGVMYANCRTVSLDDSVAVSWYRKAVDQGYAIGQYNVGVIYVRKTRQRPNGTACGGTLKRAGCWWCPLGIQVTSQGGARR